MADPKADWQDFTWFIGDYIPRQTIPILRRFASHIEIRTRLSVGLRTGDKKADIVDKIVAAFRALKARNDLQTYTSIRGLCENEGNAVAKLGGAYQAAVPAPTFGGVASAGMNGRHAYPAPAASSSTYRPAAAAPAAPGPSRNGWQSQTTTTAYGARAPTLQDWKPNPMWKPLRALSNMEMLPDIGPSEGSHTRRDRKIHVTLPPDVIEKLNQTKSRPQSHPQYSVRIFCTSSDWYKAPNTPYTPANGLITNKQMPIEYPSVPDVYVDDYPIPFKERGLRGKAGSAPPFDLDKSSKGLQRINGRMTSITFGHTGPTTGKKKEISKKFFFQIVYCEITTSDELQNRINRMVPATAADSLNLLRKKQDDDDDIVFGQSHMSLKDPLSYMRLERPVRSTKCSHLQCFEAKWWISQNIKHPQWLCPLCNRELRFDELIVDGFSLDILDVVPEQYDEVVIEADNAWHTEDGNYGSAAWLTSSRAAKPSKPKDPSPEKEDRKPDAFRVSTSPDPKGKRKAIEILSSDDEDEQPLAKTTTASASHLRPPQLDPRTRATSTLSVDPSTRQPAPPPPKANKSAVIDLTADSDDEDADDADDAAGPGRNQQLPAPSSSSLAPPSLSNVSAIRRSPSANGSHLPSNTGLNGGGRSYSNGSNTATLNGNGNGNMHGANRFASSYTHNDANGNGNGNGHDLAHSSYRPPHNGTSSSSNLDAGDRDRYRPERVDSWRSGNDNANGNVNGQQGGGRQRYDDMDADSEDGLYGW